MARHDSFNKAVICTVLLAFTFGCTTTRPLTTASPQALFNSVAVGDDIEIKRNDGTKLELKVTEVSLEGIGGSAVFVPYTDMQQVSIIRNNKVGTGLLVLFGIGLLYGLEKNFDCGLFYWPNTECDE